MFPFPIFYPQTQIKFSLPYTSSPTLPLLRIFFAGSHTHPMLVSPPPPQAPPRCIRQSPPSFPLPLPPSGSCSVSPVFGPPPPSLFFILDYPFFTLLSPPRALSPTDPSLGPPRDREGETVAPYFYSNPPPPPFRPEAPPPVAPPTPNSRCLCPKISDLPL